jgi:hypothetical protein
MELPPLPSTRAAYAEVKGLLGVPALSGEPSQPVGLVPVYLALQGSTLVPVQPDVRETLLWRLGSEWSSTAAATRVCAELGLANQATLVRDQINNGLVRFGGGAGPPVSDPPGAPRLVAVALDVTCGKLRYRDRLLWDVAEPPSEIATKEFAAGACADLGLRCDSPVLCTAATHPADSAEFAAAISAQLEEQLAALGPAALAGEEGPLPPSDAFGGPTLEWV